MGLLEGSFGGETEDPAQAIKKAAAPDAAVGLATNYGGLQGSQQGAFSGLSNTGVSGGATPAPPQGMPGQQFDGAMGAFRGAFGDAMGAHGNAIGYQAGGGAMGFAPGEMDPNSGLGGVRPPAPPAAPADPAQKSDFGARVTDMMSKLQASGGNPQEQAMAHDELARTLSTSLTDAGHDVKWQGSQLMVDGRAYTVAGAPGTAAPGGTNAAGTMQNNSMPVTPMPNVPVGNGAPQPQSTTTETSTSGPQARDYNLPDVLAAGGIQQPNLPQEMQDWRPQGGGYTPGEITSDDIPDFTREQLMNEMYQNPGSAAGESLMQRMFEHPESLDQRTTDTMKAQSKNTLAEQQRQEEDDMMGFGASAGIGDSNWMASQRLSSRRDRDAAVAKSNQDVDIKAAVQNQQDRLAAAGVANTRQGVRNEAATAATSAALNRAAITGDRMQLRESVKQEAAKLKISEDQVMSNHILETQKSLTQKYGIDVGAQIDLSKLSESSKQHKEDLVQKMAELEKSLSVQMAGIGSNASIAAGQLGLGYDKFNADRDDTDWSHNYMLGNFGGG